MNNWEKNIRKVVPYTPGEQPKDSGIIKLNTNENPYPPSPRVKAVMDSFNDADMRLYPDTNSTVLVEALAKKYNVNPSIIKIL